MILPLPKGAIEVPVPDKLKALIPANYVLEASNLNDGTDTISLSIIKMRSVTCRLLDTDFKLPDNELKSRIIEPMLNNLNRI